MSDKVKLNIQNERTFSDSDRQEIQNQQYQQREERDEKPETGNKKTGLLIFIFCLIIIATNIAMFLFMSNKNKKLYMKFIPESAIMSASISSQNLKNILTSNQNSLIFPNAVSVIKEQSAELSIDFSDIFSYIKQDIIVAFIKSSDSEKAENTIIVQLPKESSFKQEIEDKIKRNFNVNYSTYRGEAIVNVSSLSFEESNMNFSYAITEDVLLISNSETNVRSAIDAGRY